MNELKAKLVILVDDCYLISQKDKPASVYCADAQNALAVCHLRNKPRPESYAAAFVRPLQARRRARLAIIARPIDIYVSLDYFTTHLRKEAHQARQYSTKSQNYHPVSSQSSLYISQLHHPNQTDCARHERPAANYRKAGVR